MAQLLSKSASQLADAGCRLLQARHIRVQVYFETGGTPIFVTERGTLEDNQPAEWGLYPGTPAEIGHIQDSISRTEVSLIGMTGYVETLGWLSCTGQTMARTTSRGHAAAFIFARRPA